MIDRVTRRGASLLLLLFTTGLAIGCATSAPSPEPLPRHPFPRWVSHLEPGHTDIEDVRATFGTPSETEEDFTGRVVWRYAYPEIRWSPLDPRRPEIAADGRPIEEPPTWGQRAMQALDATTHTLDRLLFYPPTQPGRRKSKMRPATIHALELEFGSDGRLRRHRYTTREDFVSLDAS